MGLKAGIVGLPNVGKSTLFNAITKKNVLAANYPFATIEPNVGIVELPDERMDYLKNLYLPASFVPTAFEFIDIAGLVAGASKGEGLGNKFLSHIREVDAICEVVRCFENSNITHVSGQVDPTRDVDIINVELMLADLEVVYNRINKIGKKASLSADKEVKAESLLLEKLKSATTSIVYLLFPSLSLKLPVCNLPSNAIRLPLSKNFDIVSACLRHATTFIKSASLLPSAFVKFLFTAMLNLV